MIKKLNSSEYNFYFLMGKFFADRSIIKEMDCQIYNEEGMEWYVNFNKEGQIVGFASIQKKNNGTFYLDNFYVILEYRNKGIGKELLKAVLKDHPKNVRLISRNEVAIHMFEKYGFKEYGHNGRYKKMSLE